MVNEQYIQQLEKQLEDERIISEEVTRLLDLQIKENHKLKKGISMLRKQLNEALQELEDSEDEL